MQGIYQFVLLTYFVKFLSFKDPFDSSRNIKLENRESIVKYSVHTIITVITVFIYKERFFALLGQKWISWI